LFDFSKVATGSGNSSGVVFGYGAIPTERVEEGLRRIHDCLLRPTALRTPAASP